jgi:hypothetical protein
MRPRKLLLSVFAALLGAAIVVPPALAAPSEEKLEIAEHCYFADWPCWNVKGNNPEDIRQIQPFTIAQGGTISFEDNEARYPTDVIWKGTAPSCTSGVPEAPPTKTGWSGTCTFANAGDYDFESQELFNDGTFNYTKYEVVVEGASTTPPVKEPTKEPPTKEPVKEPTKEPAKELPTKEPSPASTPAGGNPTAIASTMPSQGATTSPPVAPPTAPSTVNETKPLTQAQKLASALKQCKKQPKKKRAQCETKARKLYAPKHKKQRL